MYSFPGQSPAPTSAPDMHSSDASYGTPFTDDLAPDRSHQHGSTVQDPYLPSILGMKWTTNLKSVGDLAPERSHQQTDFPYGTLCEQYLVMTVDTPR